MTAVFAVPFLMVCFRESLQRGGAVTTMYTRCFLLRLDTSLNLRYSTVAAGRRGFDVLLEGVSDNFTPPHGVYRLRLMFLLLQLYNGSCRISFEACVRLFLRASPCVLYAASIVQHSREAVSMAAFSNDEDYWDRLERLEAEAEGKPTPHARTPRAPPPKRSIVHGKRPVQPGTGNTLTRKHPGVRSLQQPMLPAKARANQKLSRAPPGGSPAVLSCASGSRLRDVGSTRPAVRVTGSRDKPGKGSGEKRLRLLAAAAASEVAEDDIGKDKDGTHTRVGAKASLGATKVSTQFQRLSSLPPPPQQQQSAMRCRPSHGGDASAPRQKAGSGGPVADLLAKMLNNTTGGSSRSSRSNTSTNLKLAHPTSDDSNGRCSTRKVVQLVRSTSFQNSSMSEGGDRRGASGTPIPSPASALAGPLVPGPPHPRPGASAVQRPSPSLRSKGAEGPGGQPVADLLAQMLGTKTEVGKKPARSTSNSVGTRPTGALHVRGSREDHRRRHRNYNDLRVERRSTEDMLGSVAGCGGQGGGGGHRRRSSSNGAVEQTRQLGMKRLKVDVSSSGRPVDALRPGSDTSSVGLGYRTLDMIRPAEHVVTAPAGVEAERQRPRPLVFHRGGTGVSMVRGVFSKGDGWRDGGGKGWLSNLMLLCFRLCLLAFEGWLCNLCACEEGTRLIFLGVL